MMLASFFVHNYVLFVYVLRRVVEALGFENCFGFLSFVCTFCILYDPVAPEHM